MNIFLVTFAVLSLFSPLVCADFSLSNQIYELCEGTQKQWEKFIGENKGLFTQEIVNKIVDKKSTLLSRAISKKKLDIALFLIECGADVSAASGDDENTPLHFIINLYKLLPAELKKNIGEFFAACEKKGAKVEVNQKNKYDVSPLRLLFDSVKDLDQELIELFIAKGADVHEIDKEGDNLLHIACYRQPHLAKFLIEKGVDVNKENSQGKTPLHTACFFNPDATSVIALLNSGKINDVNKQTKNFGYSPLHFAAVGKLYGKVVEELLKYKGIDINAQNNNGNTALHIATCNSCLETINYLLADKRIDINKQNKQGETALHIAVITYGESIAQRPLYLSIIKKLLCSNIDRNIKNKGGKTALELVEADNKEIRALFDKDYLNSKDPLASNSPVATNLNPDPAKTPFKAPQKISKTIVEYFFKAIENGELSKVEEFLKDQPNLIQEKFFGDTPLHQAAEYGRVDIVELLVSKENIDINAKNSFNETALHKLFSNSIISKTETLLVLLNVQGIDVNIKNNGGATPLHRAASDGSAEDVELLIKNGAKVNEKNNESQTPILWAIFSENRPVIEVLIQNGADVNEITTYSDTLLHVASRMGNRKIVELLVQSGANMYAKDGQDKTPFEKSTGDTVKEYLSKVMRNRTICSGMQITSLCLAAGAAVCAWYESKTTSPSKEKKKNSFKKILSQKKKTIFLGLASLALFGGSFCIKKA